MMTYRYVNGDRLRPVVDQWVQQHLEQIRQAMMNERAVRLRMTKFPETYSFDSRVLSEMKLCESWRYHTDE